MFRFLAASLVSLSVGVAAIASPASDLRNKRDFERPARIAFPANAPYSPQAAALGKMLFFDPRISGAQNMSCATCHNPSFGWETPVPRAIGALNIPLSRHAPTVENLAESNHLFWDGRARTLEEQAIGPITNPKEMNAQLTDVVSRLSAIADYRKFFDIAFPREGLSPETVLRAIATYERTLRSGWAPFDDWVAGDETAISESAKRGFEIFAGKGQCASCHSGWAFTDHAFHDVGLRTTDLGRGSIDTGDPDARYTFRTPGLRNIALRAPYMHHGGLSSLQAVIEHYNSGGEKRPTRDGRIEAIDLSPTEIEDLIAFLQTLTARNPHVSAPALPVQ